ncbi:MAG TPA: O-antigen ligase family protein, partial [Armatimonadaceae bacterium]|nr:O-antigen ligase family protein [Armatimonadaceae bacterium]
MRPPAAAVPEDRPLLPRLGFWALMAALALAPLLGGTPVGSTYAFAAYGGDTMLGVLRALTLIACLLLLLFSSPSRATPAPGPGMKAAFAAALTLSLARAWVVLSLLVHSAFLTRETLLFAMVPEVLNWFCFALVFGQGPRLTADRRDAVIAAGAVTAGALLVGVVGALEYGGAADRAAHRTVSTFFSPNFTAGFLALTLPVAVALCVGARSLFGVVGSGAAAALGFGVLISTGSRAGIALALLGLVLALALAVVRSVRGKGAAGVRLPWGRVAALAALLLALGFAFRAPLLGRVAAPTAATAPANGAANGGAAAPQEHSGEFRKETWKGSLAMARANPVFGAGPGTFPYTYPRYATVAWTGLAHSSYLQVASEAGFPALILAGAAGLIALLAGLRAALAAPDADEAAASPFLVCGIVGGIAASLGRGFFDSEWSLLGNALPFWALAGMAAAWRAFAPAAAPSSAAAAAAPPPSRAAGRRLGAALAVGLPLVATLLLLSGNTARDAAMVLQQAGKPEEAARAARASLGAWPPDPQLFFLAGQPERAAALEPSGRRVGVVLDDGLGLREALLRLRPVGARGGVPAERRVGESGKGVGQLGDGADRPHRPLAQRRHIPPGRQRPGGVARRLLSLGERPARLQRVGVGLDRLPERFESACGVSGPLPGAGELEVPPPAPAGPPGRRAAGPGATPRATPARRAPPPRASRPAGAPW